MDAIKDQISFYSSALQLRGKRNNILASNIANAATPNYKARDISFEDEIKKCLKRQRNTVLSFHGISTCSYKKHSPTALVCSTFILQVPQ